MNWKCHIFCSANSSFLNSPDFVFFFNDLSHCKYFGKIMLPLFREFQRLTTNLLGECRQLWFNRMKSTNYWNKACVPR